MQCFQTGISPFPTIVKDRRGKFTIQSEDDSIFNDPVNEFSHAFEAWFACYLVFAIQYPLKLAKTCQFIENFIVGHKTKVPAHVNTCASKLKLK